MAEGTGEITRQIDGIKQALAKNRADSQQKNTEIKKIEAEINKIENEILKMESEMKTKQTDLSKRKDKIDELSKDIAELKEEEQLTQRKLEALLTELKVISKK